jgi:DNA-binding GntR family transcriptional regulator
MSERSIGGSNRRKSVLKVVVVTAESLLRGSKVDRTDLEERVYSELRARILARDLPPGTVLTLRQVAEALQVSATPVRDALRRLQSDGLVRDGGKQGVSVIGLDAGDIADLFGARLAIEGYAARLATAPVESQTLAEMERIALQFPETFDGDHYVDYERFQALDSAFHIHIIAATENARLVSMYQALNVHIHLARIYQREVEQRAQANHREHLAIVNALARRDPDGMARAVEIHIVNVRDHILSKLGPASLI